MTYITTYRNHPIFKSEEGYRTTADSKIGHQESLQRLEQILDENYLEAARWQIELREEGIKNLQIGFPALIQSRQRQVTYMVKDARMRLEKMKANLQEKEQEHALKYNL